MSETPPSYVCVPEKDIEVPIHQVNSVTRWCVFMATKKKMNRPLDAPGTCDFHHLSALARALTKFIKWRVQEAKMVVIEGGVCDREGVSPRVPPAVLDSTIETVAVAISQTDYP